jgi:hypothetical protein
MALRDLPKKVRSLFTGWTRVVVVVAVAGRATAREVLHDSLDASHASLNASYASLNAS